MKIKNIVWMMAVGWLLGACTADDDAMQGGRDVPIRLGIALTEPSDANVRATTRTASSYQNTELIAGAPVDVYIKDTGTGSMVANPVLCTVSGASGDLTYAGDLYYPASGADVSIYAIHPRVASGAAHTVSADQTSDANYAASDLIFSKSTNYHYSNSAQTLPMVHLMSQIVVNITLPSAWAGRAITNLKLHAKRTATITYPVDNSNGYTLAASGDAEAISISQGGAALIPPQTITSGSTFITFHVAGVGPYAYALPSNTTFAPGHRYVYTITPQSGTLSFGQTTCYHVWQKGNFTNNSLSNTGNGQVVYTSSNTSVATVNPATGEVTPLAAGDATITASVAEGMSNFYSTTSASYNLIVRDKRMNALWYVAENNVKSYNYSTKVVTLESNPAAAGSSQCYSWEDAMAYFGKQGPSYNTYWAGDITDGTTAFKYHLPCMKEWISVVGSYIDMFNSSFQPSGGLISSAQTCIFGYNDATKAGIADWSYWSPYSEAVSGHHIRYAFRYLGTPYCSVWKYDVNTNDHTVTITSRLIDYLEKNDASLGNKLTSYMNDASFWTSLNEDEGALKRIFYFVGYRWNGGVPGTGTADAYLDTDGYYWSTTETSEEDACRLVASEKNGGVLCVNSPWHKVSGFSVRLFRAENIGEIRTDPGVAFDNVTSSHLKHYVAKNGKVYLTRSLARVWSGSEAVGVICFTGSVSNYFNKFIALALHDAQADRCHWSAAHTAVNSFAGSNIITVGSTQYKTNSIGNTYYDRVTNGTGSSSKTRGSAAVKGWRIPSVTDWRYIFQGLGGPSATSPVGVGSGESYKYGDGTALHTAINDASGNSELQKNDYWSSSEYSSNNTQAWYYLFHGAWFYIYSKESGGRYVRAAFAW